MKKTSMLFLLLIIASSLTAQTVGIITYVEGEAYVSRADGTEEKADFGLFLEEYDVISTGEDGYLIWEFTEESGFSGEIQLEPSTISQIVIDKEDNKELASMELLSGEIFLKINKLAGSQDLSVHTQSAAMGVRGTQFTVSTSPAGDILVVCTEGKVECVDDEGEKAFAEPGKAVEKRLEERLRTTFFKLADAKRFKEEWMTGRMEAFKANAAKAFGHYAKLYRERKKAFLEAYKELVKKHDIIEKWAREYKQGTIKGGGVETLKEKKELVPVILKLKKEMFLFSRVYYRVLELRNYYYKGVKVGVIEGGERAENFIKEVEKDSKILKENLKYVHRAMFLFKQKGAGFLGESLF
ncbi:FecR family protein [Spirochaetia bacterium 38H-sp]|uniref:FecR family protein n=1 Tax=Rarispira pelagica TaxID=3141764 RepID=A0ABU9U9U8_9SPIR